MYDRERNYDAMTGNMIMTRQIHMLDYNTIQASQPYH